MPVIALDDARSAVPVALALLDGGISYGEIVLRTPAALDSLRAIAAEVPQFIVGAGTVVDAAGLAAVQKAGARFAVSPGITPALLAAAAGADLPFLPAIGSASELMQAHDAGFDCCKLFPAAVLGVAMLRALHGPFPAARFCATGGITPQNAASFLALPNVLAVGASWLVPPAAIAARDWQAIRTLASQQRL
jgi:2-dehydro-3-deoxyphosphogluconate aldolase/(4S)-4-hydroxy-2-oxoglutarate aldolase